MYNSEKQDVNSKLIFFSFSIERALPADHREGCSLMIKLGGDLLKISAHDKPGRGSQSPCTDVHLACDCISEDQCHLLYWR